MLTTPHAIAGATIGVLLPHPLIAVPLAIGSHFVLDSVPHWQETLSPYIPHRQTYIRIPIDFVLAITAVATIAAWHPENALLIYCCAIAANFPDADCITIFFPRWRKGLIKLFWNWHCWIQRETKSPWGLLTQATLIGLCFVLTY